MATMKQRKTAEAVVGGGVGVVTGVAIGAPVLLATRAATNAITSRSTTAARLLTKFGPYGIAAAGVMTAGSMLLRGSKAYAQVKAAGGTDSEARKAAGLGALGGKDTGVALATHGTQTGVTIARQKVDEAREKAEKAEQALQEAGRRIIDAKAGKALTKAQADLQKRGEEASRATRAYRDALDAEKLAQRSTVGAEQNPARAEDDKRSFGKAVLDAAREWVGKEVESPYAKERSAIESQIKTLQDSLQREQGLGKDGKPLKGSNGGFGANAREISRQIETQQAKLSQVSEKESAWKADNDSAKQYGTLAAMFSASAAGLLFGMKNSGVDKIAANAGSTARAVNKAAGEAGDLLKKPGVLSGTPAGDKAKGIVQEVFKRGGSHSPFASPGYPASTKTPQALFSATAATTPGAYAIPALYGVEAGLSFGASQVQGQPQSLRTAERIASVGALAASVGALKTVVTSKLPTPDIGKLAAVEGLRNRLSREGARKAEQQVTAATVKGATAQAKGRAQVTANRASADVAASRVGRDRMRGAAAAEGAQLGVTQARARSTVGVARATAAGNERIAKQVANARVTRAAAQGDAARRARGRGLQTTKSRTDQIGNVYQQPNRKGGLAKAIEVSGNVGKAKAIAGPNYKDTWTDKRGRRYQRRDRSVRG